MGGVGNWATNLVVNVRETVVKTDGEFRQARQIEEGEFHSILDLVLTLGGGKYALRNSFIAEYEDLPEDLNTASGALVEVVETQTPGQYFSVTLTNFSNRGKWMRYITGGVWATPFPFWKRLDNTTPLKYVLAGEPYREFVITGGGPSHSTPKGIKLEFNFPMIITEEFNGILDFSCSLSFDVRGTNYHGTLRGQAAFQKTTGSINVNASSHSFVGQKDWSEPYAACGNVQMVYSQGMSYSIITLTFTDLYHGNFPTEDDSFSIENIIGRIVEDL